MKKFSDLYFNATKSIYKKYGFANHKIITEWNRIVGSEFAKICAPEKINFPPNKTSGGILYITVNNPGFALSVQAQENTIIEKIATYFGYKAVVRIRIKILPYIVCAAQNEEPIPVPVILDKRILKGLKQIKDKELQNALIGLANTINF